MYQLRDHQQEVEALQQRFSNERQAFVSNLDAAIPELKTSLLKSGLSKALRFGAKRIGTTLIRRKDRRAAPSRKPKRRRIALIATVSAAVFISQLLALKNGSRRS